MFMLIICDIVVVFFVQQFSTLVSMPWFIHMFMLIISDLVKYVMIGRYGKRNFEEGKKMGLHR